MKNYIEKAKSYIGKKILTGVTLGALALCATGCQEGNGPIEFIADSISSFPGAVKDISEGNVDADPIYFSPTRHTSTERYGSNSGGVEWMQIY